MGFTLCHEYCRWISWGTFLVLLLSSYFHSSPLSIINTALSPSVKQASGSSDSSGSSSTESTPSPGGRISTVLPSEELRFRGSTSSFCIDEEEELKVTKQCLKFEQFSGYWSQPSELVIIVIHHSHVIQCHNCILSLRLGTVIAHRVGLLELLSQYYHHHHMQHWSNVPTGVDISFTWGLRLNYVQHMAWGNWHCRNALWVHLM